VELRAASSGAHGTLTIRDNAIGSSADALTTAAPHSERPRLIRAIGRWALTAAVINSVIGSGVFGLPAPLAALAGQWSPITVLLAGLSILTIVLCFAEVGSRFDEAGGPYLYSRTAFGPAVGFQVGWLHLWTRIISAAAVLNVLSSYLVPLIPWTGTTAGRATAMIVAVTIVTAINVIGVRQASWTVNFFTIAKLLPLFAVIALAALQFDTSLLASQAVAEPKWTDAVLLLVFGYGGFESAVVAASETKNPKKDTAFALIAAMAAITAIYCLMQLAVVSILPNAAESTAPVAATLGQLIGPAGLTLGAIAVVISVFGWLTGFALMSPRIVFSMADKHDLPVFLAHVHPSFRTPWIAVIISSALALSLALAGSFGQLATFSAVTRLGIYIVTCGALIVLRRRWGLPEGFRAPGGPAMAMAGIAFCIWMISTRTLAQAWYLPLVVAAGAVVWFAMRRTRSRATTVHGRRE